MSWPEVATAKKEKRHELVLAGPVITEKIQKYGLDANIFSILSLNYLNIHDTKLETIPDDIKLLTNLQTLVLHSNQLNQVPAVIGDLDKLKLLDLSFNNLKEIPESFSELNQLTSLNVSSNQLESFPKFATNAKLQVINLANNKLVDFPNICHPDMVALADLKLQLNQIAEISPDVKNLTSLKSLDLTANKLTTIPKELADCNKLKEIMLKDNPIADRKLLKVVNASKGKPILDLVRTMHGAGDSKKGGGKGKKSKKESESVDLPDDPNKLKLQVLMHNVNETISIIVDEDVKKVRGHILACIVKGIQFDEQSLKQFIQLQTKLHDGICEKRNAATLATHDISKIVNNKLTYTAVKPEDLKLQPLNRTTIMTGKELFTKLQLEAESLRKEKKRNVYSGIHKYLYLLEGQKLFPCLNDNERTISFPPITNSETTKIGLGTTSMFIEVTSATSQGICRKVLDSFLLETILLLNADLSVEQVKNTDVEGNLKSIYPSKNDLIFGPEVNVTVTRN